MVTPEGKAFLIDAGGTLDGEFDIGARVVLPYLKHCGVMPDNLEYIFLTHAHADHAGGAGAVWRWQSREEKARLITAGEGREAYAAAMYLSGTERAMMDISSPEVGTVFDIDGVRAEIIAAGVANSDKAVSRGNE